MADAEALGKERDSHFYGNQTQPGQLEHRELEAGVVKGLEGGWVVQDLKGHFKDLKFYST